MWDRSKGTPTSEKIQKPANFLPEEMTPPGAPPIPRENSVREGEMLHSSSVVISNLARFRLSYVQVAN